VIGRFISADSIIPNLADPQSLNRYSYCLNNPLKYTDPSGHGDDTPYDNYKRYYGSDPPIVVGTINRTQLTTYVYAYDEGVALESVDYQDMSIPVIVSNTKSTQSIKPSLDKNPLVFGGGPMSGATGKGMGIASAIVDLETTAYYFGAARFPMAPIDSQTFIIEGNFV
jgi:hypothetical protein